MRRSVLCLLVLGAAGFVAAAEEPYGTVLVKDVMVPMRDGVRLSTDVYRPARSGVAVEGRFPVILERTPYNKEESDFWARRFVPHGYVFVTQDVRGRFKSEGRWRALVDDGGDGSDTARWIAAQPWSDGGIGTIGGSYVGGTQHALALAGAPNVKAMVPIDAMSNCGRYGLRHHGAFELRFFNWIFNFGFSPPRVRQPGNDPAATEVLGKLRDQVRDYLTGLPLRPGTTPLRFAPDYESWLVEAMSHGENDSYWTDMGVGVVDHVADYADVPVYLVGGWYDSWAAQTSNLNYAELAKAKKGPVRLIMGPWTHGGQRRGFAGEADFGNEAAIDLDAFQLRWFDRWLKGVDNGVDREAPVRLFVMGGGDGRRTPEGRLFVGGQWREENEWPLARARPTAYYLQRGGGLSTEPPAAAPPTPYLFDPRRPVPTIGGNLSSTPGLVEAGAYDQRCRKDVWRCEDERPLSARNDVLVFRTAPLERDLEVTGRLVVKLWASSSAVDTDFTAKLVDVYPPSADFPGGVDLNVGDSIVRARYRDSLVKAAPMKPGQVYPFTIELYPTSLVFKRGHRIRLDVSSSNFPRFDVNPNTGEPLNDNRRWAVAENSIFHDPEHPSHIVLPVVPAAER